MKQGVAGQVLHGQVAAVLHKGLDHLAVSSPSGGCQAHLPVRMLNLEVMSVGKCVDQRHPIGRVKGEDQSLHQVGVAIGNGYVQTRLVAVLARLILGQDKITIAEFEQEIDNVEMVVEQSDV